MIVTAKDRDLQDKMAVLVSSEPFLHQVSLIGSKDFSNSQHKVYNSKIQSMILFFFILTLLLLSNRKEQQNLDNILEAKLLFHYKGEKDGFIKGKSSLANLITFHNSMTDLVDKGKTVFSIDFSKVFNAVSSNIFTEKLINYGLDEQTFSSLRWVENWLNG